MIEAIVIGWVLAVLFALTAIACACIAGDRRYERDRAVEERDQALTEVAELRAGFEADLLADTQPMPPIWHPFTAPAELSDAEVNARFADLQRTFHNL